MDDVSKERPVIIWVNGRLTDGPTTSAVSPLDHGLTTGDGVFETIKLTAGHPFAVTRHLDRLKRSAVGLGLPEPDTELARKAIDEVIQRDTQTPIARIRVTYTGGVSGLSSQRGPGTPTMVVACERIDAPPPVSRVVTVPWVRNERGATTGLKTTSYAENVRALAYAHDRNAAEAIFANTVGRLCEGTGSNVFCVIDGRVFTPPLAAGPLAGVTRSLVLDWCDGVEERDLDMGVLLTADEIFLTSSIRDVQPVIAVDDRDGLPAPGPVTQRVMACYAQHAAADIDP